MAQLVKSKVSKRLAFSRKPRVSGMQAFHALNGAQFLGALNDNLFKFLSIYLLIDLKGSSASTDVAFWIGIAFVAPFLLFSSTAGVLADRFSKQRVIILLKFLEIVIIAASFFAFYYKSPFGCYSLVFMLCLQSALMGPSKYSIIPELVGDDKIAKANGLITSFTYFACIMGSVLASAVTQITGGNFMIGAGVCMFVAVMGFLFSIFIPYTEPKRSTNKISPLVVAQAIKTFKHCRRIPKLRVAVLGSAFFLFIGAYLQLNLIPFAIDSLGLTSAAGGYLFSGCAIGIAVGAVIAGRLCRKELDLGLSCFSIMILGAILFAVPFFASSVVPVAFAMIGIGLCGGLFVVPLESYIQAFSPSEMRGQVIALSSFLSFMGVLLAPLCLIVFGKFLGFSASSGFVIMGLIVLATFTVLAKYLCGHFLNYLSRLLIQPFYDLHFISYPFGLQNQEDKVAVVFRKRALRHLFLLLGESSKFHLFIVRRTKRKADWFLAQFSSITFLYSEDETTPQPHEIKKDMGPLAAITKPIFIFTNVRSYKTFKRSNYFQVLQDEHHYDIRHFEIRNTARFKPHWKKPFKRTHLTYHFDEGKRAVKIPHAKHRTKAHRDLQYK